MKTILLLLLPCFARAQSIALVDRAFKVPLTVTDTLTARQLSGKLFPIYTSDLDSVILLTEYLARYIDAGTVYQPEMHIRAVGHSQFAVTTQRMGQYNTYGIFLNTRSGNLGAALEVVKRGNGNKKAAQQLHLFLDYLKNNRHIATAEKN
jgi:hypothetical protein